MSDKIKITLILSITVIFLALISYCFFIATNTQTISDNDNTCYSPKVVKEVEKFINKEMSVFDRQCLDADGLFHVHEGEYGSRPYCIDKKYQTLEIQNPRSRSIFIGNIKEVKKEPIDKNYCIVDIVLKNDQQKYTKLHEQDPDNYPDDKTLVVAGTVNKWDVDDLYCERDLCEVATELKTFQYSVQPTKNNELYIELDKKNFGNYLTETYTFCRKRTQEEIDSCYNAP